MSIRDIIERASGGSWTLGKGSMTIREDSERMRFIARVHIPGEMRRFTSQQQNANATFIATFDPEHVALMEAVVEAAAAPDLLHDIEHSWPKSSLGRSLEALIAYRQEKGLEPAKEVAE